MKRRPSAYAKFVQHYAKAHPSLPKDRLFADAARAWHGRHVERNPEVEIAEGEVLVLYPTSLRGEAEIEVPPGVRVERVSEEELEELAGKVGEARNPRGRGRRRSKPTMRCPACRGEVRVPAGVREGRCPHCGRKVKVVGR
jgi:hypothetical protein